MSESNLYIALRQGSIISAGLSCAAAATLSCKAYDKIVIAMLLSLQLTVCLLACLKRFRWCMHWLGIAVWALNLSTPLVRMLYPQLESAFADTVGNRALATAMTMFTNVLDQSHARQVLPNWLVLMLAQFHTLVLVAFIRFIGKQPWGYAVAMPHACTLLLPWAVHFAYQKHEAAHAKARAAATLRKTQQLQSTMDQKQGVEVKAECAAPVSDASCSHAVDQGEIQCAPLSGKESCTAVLGKPNSCLASAAQAMFFPSNTVKVAGKFGYPSTNVWHLYKSPLEVRAQASVKIFTESTTKDIPTDLVIVLQQALDGLEPKLHVSSMAARDGCILLNLDLLLQPETVSGLANTMSALASKASISTAVAQALLLGLQQTIARNGPPDLVSGNCQTKPALSLAHGTAIVANIAGQTFKATWDQSNASFLAVPLSSKTVSVPETKLGLSVLVDEAQAVSSPMYDDLSPTGEIEALNAASDNSYAYLLLQVWDWMSDNGTIQGWKPPTSNSQVPMHETPAGLRVLAHVDGCYLTTRVHHKVEDSHDGQACQMTTVQVGVGLSDLAQFAGKASCQLLTVELWYGDVCLSTSHVVLDAQQLQHLQSKQKKNRIAFWGANDEVVQSAFSEVQAFDRQMWQLGASLPADLLLQRQTVMADLTVWMRSVRHAVTQTRSVGGIRRYICNKIGVAPKPNHCQHQTSSIQSATSAFPPLKPALLVKLGTALSDYASDNGMVNLHAMIQCQMDGVVKVWCDQQTAAARSKPCPVGLPSLPCLLWLACFGFECEQCEKAYKERLSEWLAGMQSSASGIQLAMAIVSFPHCAAASRGLGVLILFWAVCHAGVCVSHFRRPQGTPARCSILSIYAGVLRTAMSAGIGFGFIGPEREAIMASCANLPAWTLMHTTMTLAEQLPAVALLPHWLRWLLVMLDIPGLAGGLRFSVYSGSSWFSAITALLCVSLSPVLLSAHLRTMLATPQKRHRQATDITARQACADVSVYPAQQSKCGEASEPKKQI